MDLGLKGKVVVITGSARGIGYACAEVFAEEGACVCINDINAEDGETAARTLSGKGFSAFFTPGNVAVEADVKALFRTAHERFGSIDILVNNAAISPKTQFEDLTAEEFQRVLQVNLTGAFLCSREAVTYMKEKRWGRIVNLSSMAGRFGANHAALHYSSSKAGILGMTMTLGKKLGKHNITVNSVAPGRIDTILTQVLPEDVRADIISQIPLGRLGTCREVANVVAFLASEPGGYVTGANVDIMGGYIA
ncbi:3-oxoacyl-(acyl-carrier-protein) reductase FabG [uncultured delta proteobacterium]|uniref:3-oxoacyl-(Acyl-carrier-protein) reductase FabG n=1 Tax=uncultured delta proteobacterium TaxID=34034 RepID=A0A212KA51_9DELT|nr:3-oxoacyl-(acyl-carrier-protein) reductase FabG [uncultured delta proteobacterium]